MKKKYISPATTLIKVHTENVLNGVSKTDSEKYDGTKGGHGIDGNIGTWNESDDFESAKGNDGFIFWEDEN